jgi:hypothetical protein
MKTRHILALVHACLEELKLQVDTGDGLVAAGVGLSAVEDSLDVRQLLLDVREAIGDVALEGDLDAVELNEVRVQVLAELIATGLQSLNLQVEGVEAGLQGLLRDKVFNVAKDANII